MLHTLQPETSVRTSYNHCFASEIDIRDPSLAKGLANQHLANLAQRGHDV